MKKNSVLLVILFIVSLFNANASGASEQHCRSALTGSSVSAYDKIRDAAFLMEKETYIGAVSASDVDSIFLAVLGDHPNIFWVSGCEYHPATGIMTFTYSTDIEGRKRMQRQIYDAVSSVSGTSATEIREWFVRSCTYDSKNLDQTMYSALVKKSGVCASFAKAFQYVALLRGIDCVTVSGLFGEYGTLHDYNIVFNEDGSRTIVDISSDLVHPRGTFKTPF